MPGFNPSAPGAPCTYGEYMGNGAANRAIPHNLGNTPAIVFIMRELAAVMFRIHRGEAYIAYWAVAAQNKLDVTAMDNINFYVGNAGDAINSANGNVTPHFWVAIGAS